IREREDTVAFAFTVNAKLAVFDEHVAHLQLQNFGRAHSTQQHQVNDCEVAVATKAAEELEDFRTRERLDDPPPPPDAQAAPPKSWQLLQTENAVVAAPSIVGRGADCTWSVLEVMSRTESVQQPRGRQSPVDAPRLCTRKALRADVLKQHLAGQGAQRVSGAA